MSTENQENNLITILSQVCLEKLEENRHKKHWNEFEIMWLFDRIEEEIKELKKAVISGKPVIDVWREAADVANFAAFIAQNFETLK